MPNRKVTVVVVEDHPLYRFALEHALTGDDRLHRVASVADGALAIEAITRLTPDVVLVDLDLPGMDGMTILSHLDPRTVTALVLSADGTGSSVYRALAAGAHGYITKDLDAREIREAVCAAARGETVISRRLQAAVAEEIRARSTPAGPTFTSREQQVLALIAQGSSTADIGRRLHISQSTVKSHLSAVYAKLGVRDRGAAVATAVKRGLVGAS